MDKELILYQIKEFFTELAEIFKCYFKIGNKDINIINRILITAIFGVIILLIVLLNYSIIF